MENLIVRSERELETKTFFYKFDPMGWAMFMLVPELSALVVRSDWGSGGHIWRESRSLANFAGFLVSCNPAYIMDKFGYERKEDWKPVDSVSKTRARIEEYLDERARDCDWRAEKRGELQDEVDNFISDAESYGSMTVALANMDHELQKALGYEPYEFCVTVASGRYKFFRDTLIPWFQQQLRTRVL